MTLHTPTVFLATSLFLCDHEALGRFARLAASRDLARGDASAFVVVCERKEDLLAVRAFLAHAVATQSHPKPSGASGLGRVGPRSVAGVTMYTLDSLAEAIMKSLALTPEGGLLNATLRTDFRKPFLDIVTQEKLLRVLLLRLRFPAGDALSTAKQILTLLDVAFPEGENLFGLLLETQRLEKGHGAQGRHERQLTETAFKQILCAYHGATGLMPQFSRLQRLVLDYLDRDFRDHVRTLKGLATELESGAAADADFAQSAHLAFPQKFLQSHMLWFAAPEYGDPQRFAHGYRPGNFQANIVDIFRDALFFARESLTPAPFETLHARCYLSTADPSSGASAGRPDEKGQLRLSHVEARVVAPRRRLWEQATARCMTPQAEGAAQAPALRELLLLADFPLDEERLYQAEAFGVHPLHEETLTAFAKGQIPASAPGEENAWDELARGLGTLWDELSEAVSLLDSFSGDLESTARTYGLTVLSTRDRDFLELWKSHCIGESARVGRAHPLSALPRALSFFPVAQRPDEITCLGPPHASRAPSFIVKILNDALAALARKGVSVELPATDESYRGFYLWLTSLGVPLRFWIPSLSAFEGFPEHLSHKRGVRVTMNATDPTWRTHGTLVSFLRSAGAESPSGDMFLEDARWSEHLFASKDARRGAGALTLNITQFERYVECPMKFYLVDVLRLEQNTEDFTAPPPRETGTAVHRVAERFVALYKLVGGGGGADCQANIERVRYLARVREIVEDPAFLVDAPREHWEMAITAETQRGVEASHAAFVFPLVRDLVTALFEPGYESPSRLRMQLTVEIAKRAFLRLLITEHRRLSEDPTLQVGGFAETPVELTLAGVRLKGRIDRVDFSARGYHIIDYKTSKVPRSESKVVLFPSEARTDRVKLSVQGAVYALAWAARAPEHPVADFSLYRLKNLDPEAEVMLRSSFGESPFARGSPAEVHMRETYEPIAAQLAQGIFSAKPLHSGVCAFCPATHACPVPRAKGAGA